MEEKSVLLTKSYGGYQSTLAISANSVDSGKTHKYQKINYLSFRHIGFFIYAFTVGFAIIQSGGFTYAFIRTYLGQNGAVYNISNALIPLPYSLKLIYATINDSFPILRLRRKPYMIIGWFTALVFSLIIIAVPLPESRYIIPTNTSGNCSAKYYQKLQENDYHGTSTEYTVFALIYMTAFFMINVAIAICDCAMDGLMVQYARREPDHLRGRMQSFMYAIRQFGSVVNLVLTAFGFNWYLYGGPWCDGIGLKSLFVCYIVLAVIAIPVGIFMTDEQEVDVAISFKTLAERTWQSLKSEALQRILLFIFAVNIAQNLISPADNMIMTYWAKTTNLTFSLGNVLGNVLMVVGITIFGTYLRHYNWRIIVLSTQCIMTLINGVITFMVIFDVYRNQYFYISDNISKNVFSGINFICLLIIAVEMCESETEGTFYGIVMSVNNLGQSVGMLIANTIAIPFDVSSAKRYRHDTNHDRWMVASQELVLYTLQILITVVFLPLFPSGIQATKRLKARLGSSEKWGHFLVYSYIITFFGTIAYSFISAFF